MNSSKFTKITGIAILTAVFAVNMLVVTPHVYAESPAPAITNPAQQDKIKKLKDRGVQEIDKRVAKLNELTTRISNLKRLTDSQKTSLKADLQSEVSVLSTLKVKILADTDLATLTVDVQSITKSYRVFAVYIPKMRIYTIVDAHQNIALKYDALIQTLTTRIQKAKSENKNTAQLEAQLADVVAKVNDAKQNYAAAEAIANALKPEGYPNNKTDIEKARDQLRASAQDFKAARDQIKKIRDGLKSLGIS